MDRSITDKCILETYILEILISQSLLSRSQALYVQLIQSVSNLNILQVLFDEDILDKKSLLYILPTHLYSRYQCDIISLYYNKNTNYYDDYFFQGLTDDFKGEKIARAKYYLDFLNKNYTAKNIRYTDSLLVFIFSFLILYLMSNNILCCISNIWFLSQNLIKIFLFFQALLHNYTISYKYSITSFPIYTILVPLYKEKEKIKSIIYNITQLEYPKNKLDVKIILEQDDNETHEALKDFVIPNYIHIIDVPKSFPRTKPKALNYAAQYIKGEYIVIYDAEDNPDKDQLIKAIATFKYLPDQYACLQAKLNIYNLEENLLSKCFCLEYTLWFNFLLRGINLADLPIPLGGTSNHIKTSSLHAIGKWDAYNVTEDADLGIRLYTHGYKVSILNSCTLEEAPISIDNWIYQRSRWIKGFIQTTIILIKQRHELNITFRQIIFIHTIIGFPVYSFFSIPWIILGSITTKNNTIQLLWILNSICLISCAYGAGIYILIHLKGTLRKLNKCDYLSLMIWPFYFSLNIIATYKALWDIIRNPFKWNKTTHGASKTTKTNI
ncbi:MAG: glycosyltransferase family 2 protein [Rickettsiaceae bacterium]